LHLNECSIEELGFYRIPNVFTPGGMNDVFFAYIYGCDCNREKVPCLGGDIVREIDMQIFNRAGRMVYKTNEPCINWDGRDMSTGQFVPTGVYYYSCTVYFNLGGESDRQTFWGFFHVYSDGRTIENRP
jgi:hypothetical protein